MSLLKKQRKLYPAEKDSIDSFLKLLEIVISQKEDKVSARGRPPMPLVLWKLKSYVQTSLHRIIDLSSESCKAWEKGFPAVSFLLTRSSMECVSNLFDLTNQIVPLIETDDLPKINDLVNQWKYGDRNIPGLPSITNVLTITKHVDDIIPNYRKNYEYLSNFCHPNYSAIGMLYSFQDMNEYCFYIGRKHGVRPDFFSINLKSLIGSLELLKYSLERYEKIYPEIIRIDSKYQNGSS